MRVRWFGQPWGVGGPAPICDDEQFRIPTPVGRACADCEEPIEDGDRGIATAAWIGAGESPQTSKFVFVVTDGGFTRQAVAYHLDCWIGSTVPEYRHIFPRRP